MVVIASAVDIDYTFRRNDMNTYGYNNIIIISNYRIIIMMNYSAVDLPPTIN